jgi:hypothetical protein
VLRLPTSGQLYSVHLILPGTSSPYRLGVERGQAHSTGTGRVRKPDFATGARDCFTSARCRRGIVSPTMAQARAGLGPMAPSTAGFAPLAVVESLMAHALERGAVENREADGSKAQPINPSHEGGCETPDFA